MVKRWPRELLVHALKHWSELLDGGRWRSKIAQIVYENQNPDGQLVSELWEREGHWSQWLIYLGSIIEASASL
jgi:hypothetical protein